MNKTILFNEHEKLKAKIVEFGGFLMPVYYDSIINEHISVRTNCGIFDVSHMGVFFVKGEDASDYLNYLIANNINKITDYKALYSPVCNEKGGIVDDIIIYRKNISEYMIVVNASNIKKDFEWFKRHSAQFKNLRITDMSDSFALFAVQGPKAKFLINKLGIDTDDLSYYSFKNINYKGNKISVAFTGYTGEQGYEIFLPNNQFAIDVWNEILEEGKEFGIKPIGLGARDTLRLEVCFSLYGHELNDDISPLEAGIGWAVDLKKDNFIGKKALTETSYTRKLTGFEMTERAVPRGGYSVYSGNDKIGFVTSGSYLPSVKKNMGLALLDKKFSAEGTEIEIEIRGNRVKAKTVKLPFYPPFNRRKN